MTRRLSNSKLNPENVLTREDAEARAVARKHAVDKAFQAAGSGNTPKGNAGLAQTQKAKNALKGKF